MLKTAIGYAIIHKSLVGWAVEFPLLTNNILFLPNHSIEEVIAELSQRLHIQQKINQQKGINPKNSPITNFRLHAQYSIEALQEKYGYNAPIYPVKYQII